MVAYRYHQSGNNRITFTSDGSCPVAAAEKNKGKRERSYSNRSRLF
jgi:hypothetical protein